MRAELQDPRTDPCTLSWLVWSFPRGEICVDRRQRGDVKGERFFFFFIFTFTFTFIFTCMHACMHVCIGGVLLRISPKKLAPSVLLWHFLLRYLLASRRGMETYGGRAVQMDTAQPCFPPRFHHRPPPRLLRTRLLAVLLGHLSKRYVWRLHLRLRLRVRLHRSGRARALRSSPPPLPVQARSLPPLDFRPKPARATGVCEPGKIIVAGAPAPAPAPALLLCAARSRPRGHPPPSSSSRSLDLEML